MKKRPCLRERLAMNRALIGLLQTRLSPLLIETAAQSDYDFMFVDREHGVFSDNEYELTLQAYVDTDVLTLARLANHDPTPLHHGVKAGADAIVIPHVSTADEARALVATLDEASARSELVHRPNLIVIIESTSGVTNVEEILSMDGVDGAFVGPSDLSAELGRRGDYSQPAYAEALSRIERAASDAGKFLGTAVHSGYPIQRLFSRGHRLFVLGTDARLLRDAMNAQVAATRSRLQSSQSSAKE